MRLNLENLKNLPSCKAEVMWRIPRGKTLYIYYGQPYSTAYGCGTMGYHYYWWPMFLKNHTVIVTGSSVTSYTNTVQPGCYNNKSFEFNDQTTFHLYNLTNFHS